MTELARAAAGPGTWSGAPRELDGVPHGQPVLDRLVALLDLERIEDLTLLDSVFARHGMAPHADRMLVASLDHALWFHRRFRADEWLLCDVTSPSASGGRGLATGRFFARDGRLVATVLQEVLMRVTR